MKNNIAELVFILDKSGSMHPLASDTRGGFNSMLKKQKTQDSPAYVTTIMFDTEIACIHDRVQLSDVPCLTEADYMPGGCTALFDAVGHTVKHIEMIHKYSRPEDVPASTMFVIITDGMDNSSHKFSAHQIKNLLDRKQKEAAWEFVFLGANIDALGEAENIGINSENAVNFHADKLGMTKVFNAVSYVVSNARCAKPLSEEWKEEIEQDFNSR